MGANFSSVTFKACDEKTMREKFNTYQDDMCYEHGSDSYAGHLGIAHGLNVSTMVFKDTNAAHDYIINRAEKRGPAIAVKVGDFSKVFPVTATEKKEVVKLQEMETKYKNWDSDLLLRVKQAKSTQRGCKKCGSKISVKYVKDINCPVCGDVHFIKTETDNKNFKVLQTKLKEQQNKIATLSKKYDEKNKNNCWYIGAWCAE